MNTDMNYSRFDHEDGDDAGKKDQLKWRERKRPEYSRKRKPIRKSMNLRRTRKIQW